MKKKIILRCLVGAPIGVTISTLVTILISARVGDGGFYPFPPELAADFGSELNAMLVQTGCSLLYGAAWAGASVIWEMERWSLLRMTAVHLVVCSLASFPIAYFLRWIPRNGVGIPIYFGIFFGIYLIIWLSQYLSIRAKVRSMNRKLQKDK